MKIMERFKFNVPVLFIFIVLLLTGCSKQLSEITPDQSLTNTVDNGMLKSASTAGSMKDSYIIVFKDDGVNVNALVNAEIDAAVDTEVEKLGKNFGVKSDFTYKHALKGFAATLPAAAVEALRNNPRIKYIEQNQEVHIVATQSNPPSWGLDRSDQRALPLNASYTYNQTGSGVDAYIIDTGIRLTHNDFGGRAITGYDAVTIGGTATDGNGHGTHVAGTVGGTSYGMAKGVRLIAVRVLNNQGSGTWAQVIAGLDWVVSNHTTNRAVANMSLGGGASTTVDDAVKRVVADGVVMCVAAGNDALNASGYSPARVAEAITVGATGSSDVFASFSNYGSIVDILAPGVSITSDYYSSNTATATMSGTSMATPHVAGAAALYLEANPTATPAQVEAGLKAVATQGAITSVPSGTANLLLYSIAGTPLPPTVPAAPTLSSPANSSTGIAINTGLTWNTVSGATSYNVQVSTSSSFGTTVYNATGITSTSASPAGLANNTTYYWRVSATNGVGTGAWSSVWSFTTVVQGNVPLAPVLSSPANNATNVSRTPSFSWIASAGATSYNFQLSKKSNFSSLVNNSTLTGTSTTVSGLSRTTTYYWRVSAKNAVGTSPWSVTRNFTTGR
jgi:subtilisin family serine protease